MSTDYVWGMDLGAGTAAVNSRPKWGSYGGYILVVKTDNIQINT